jgi:hypothetical protein
MTGVNLDCPNKSGNDNCYPCPRTSVTYLPGLYKGGLGGIIARFTQHGKAAIEFPLPSLTMPHNSYWTRGGASDTIAVLYRRKRTGDAQCCHCEPALSQRQKKAGEGWAWQSRLFLIIEEIASSLCSSQ